MDRCVRLLSGSHTAVASPGLFNAVFDIHGSQSRKAAVSAQTPHHRLAPPRLLDQNLVWARAKGRGLNCHTSLSSPELYSRAGVCSFSPLNQTM